MLLKLKELKFVFAAFTTTLHTEYCYSILFLMSKGLKMSNTMYCTLYIGPLAPAKWKAIYLKAFHIVGLAVHHQSNLREAALLTFLDLSNYKGDCRQDTQPNPNF